MSDRLLARRRNKQGRLQPDDLSSSGVPLLMWLDKTKSRGDMIAVACVSMKSDRAVPNAFIRRSQQRIAKSGPLACEPVTIKYKGSVLHFYVVAPAILMDMRKAEFCDLVSSGRYGLESLGFGMNPDDPEFQIVIRLLAMWDTSNDTIVTLQPEDADRIIRGLEATR